MSDPEAPQPEKPVDLNDLVDSANAGLDAAAAAGAEVADDGAAEVSDGAAEASAPDADAVDPDLAAFHEMEKAYPGTFASPPPPAFTAAAETVVTPETDAATAAFTAPDTHAEESSMVDYAYAPAAGAETQIVPSEPLYAAIAPQQPIFVQAPEPPRERGNRGTAGAIGLLATLVFAVLYLASTVGLRALDGKVAADTLVDEILAPLSTWGFWVPVAAFFFGFWLLGSMINRGRWGRWVIFGLIVGGIAYGGHILGKLIEEPFWQLTASEGLELVGTQLLAPLAIAAFLFARELTVWFGAWVARSGARKTELNAEAQREYERTLEAGPTLPR